MSQPPTYAACLTPSGSGAIATIAVRGPIALGVIEKLFQASGGRKPPVELQGHTNRGLKPSARQDGDVFYLGKFGDDTADEVVLAVKQTEPLPWVEIHCHGGREVVRMILETLRRHEVQVCSWQELERLTNDQPLRTEAAVLLAEARTVRTAAILLDQYHGAFDRIVEQILVAIEKRDAASGSRLLDELARYTRVGGHLTVPWRVVVAGEPNVGKSSLVNALAGYQRSIVSAIPGTTRDLVTTSIAIDGWPIDLIDSAGLRDNAEGLEEQGMALTQNAVASADLCLWVIDGATSPGPVPGGPGLNANVQFVLNKVDLPAGWDWSLVPSAVHVSALTGSGLADLCQAIAQRLVPEPPPPGTAVPFTPFLCEQIEEARRRWLAGQIEDVRQVLQAISRVPAARR